MLNDNALGYRLNTYKNSKPALEVNREPENTNIDVKPETIRTVNYITLTASAIVFIARAILFGLAAKIVFNTSWSFLEFTCVGFTINYIFNSIGILFNKQF
jgi:hypothetical protein